VTRPSRFGPNPKRRTVEQIERVVEWVEEQTVPFTNHDAWRHTGRGSYNTAYLALLELRDHGLLRQTNAPGSKPARWIRADIPKRQITIALEG
jgi:hypothetical protein